jgi:Protein kinase domain
MQVMSQAETRGVLGAGMEPLSASDPRAVGEFQLRARLGAGGMGQVYLGVSLAGRAVAVKVVHPGLARDPEFTRRFAREVAAARAVGGVYTAPVVAAGLSDDPPWLATAFVPGPSLSELVATHGPLPEAAVWRLAAGLAEALAAVHACGLIHRDLKPANVLLAADGPYLIDFGISRALEGTALDGTALTAVGTVVGTPGYMSPEQAEGAAAGPPSDVFSLGALLAFAATGKAPFGGGSAAAVLYRVVTGRPDLAGVPTQLRELISGCMAKNPAQRPALADLRATISRATISPTAISSTMISPTGPGRPDASPMSFWPAPVAQVISATVADAEHEIRAPQAAATTRWPAPAPDADVLAAYRYGQLPPGRQQQPPPLPLPPPLPPTRRGMAVRGAVPYLAAARLMYAGAAATLLNTIVALAVIGQIKASVIARYPLLSDGAVRVVAIGAVAAVVVEGAVSITVWLWLASAARRGRRWVRTAGSVLFGADTLVLLGVARNPGLAATKGIGVVIWLIGLLAVIALWRGREHGRQLEHGRRRRPDEPPRYH